MDIQEEQILEEIDTLQPLETHEIPISNPKDLIAPFQFNLTQVEIRSSFFYYTQKIIMFLIAIFSSSLFIEQPTIQSQTIRSFNRFLQYLSLSPSLFESFTAPFIIILFIFFLLILIFTYTLILGLRYSRGTVTNTNVFKVWIFLHRIILPLPGPIIGSYFGYYFIHLTEKLVIKELFLTIFAGIFWFWTVISCGFIYNECTTQRKSDVCQIHFSYILFDHTITLLPMFTSMLPGFLKVIFSSPVSILYGSFQALIGFIILLYIVINKPYNYISMNKFVLFIYLCKIPISFIFYIEESHPNFFIPYLVICFFLFFVHYLISEIIVTCFDKACSNSEDEVNNMEQNFTGRPHSLGNYLRDCDPTANCPFPFYLVSLTLQDILIFLSILASTVIMTVLNAVAAKRMPLSKDGLPDVVLEKFKIADQLRNSSSYGSFQFSNIAIFLEAFLAIISAVFFPRYFDIRRTAAVYSLCCFLRAISFVVTQLPAPCSGYANCPCADPVALKALKEGQTFKIAFSWLLGLGIFLVYPQCGDLIVSGHTMFIWLMGRTVANVMRYAIPRPFNYLIICIIFTIALMAMAYIMIVRNHFSIDVWFGFLLPELAWDLYYAVQTKAMKTPKDNDSWLVRLIRWIEYRPPNRQIIQNQKLMSQN